jgi:hypothetical protein
VAIRDCLGWSGDRGNADACRANFAVHEHYGGYLIGLAEGAVWIAWSGHSLQRR